MTGDGRRFVTVGAGTTASVVALLYALYEALPRQASCPHLHILDGVWGLPAARLGRPTTRCCGCWSPPLPCSYSLSFDDDSRMRLS
jgi:hypothetical protein